MKEKKNVTEFLFLIYIPDWIGTICTILYGLRRLWGELSDHIAPDSRIHGCAKGLIYPSLQTDGRAGR